MINTDADSAFPAEGHNQPPEAPRAPQPAAEDASNLVDPDVVSSAVGDKKRRAHMGIKQAFKIGFCTELARQGIAPSSLGFDFDKIATGLGDLTKASGIGDVLKGAVGTATGVVQPLVIAGLVGAPALAGYAFGSSDRINPKDLEHITHMATIEDYKRAIRLLKRQQQQQVGIKTAAVGQPGPVTQNIAAAEQRVAQQPVIIGTKGRKVSIPAQPQQLLGQQPTIAPKPVVFANPK